MASAAVTRYREMAERMKRSSQNRARRERSRTESVEDYAVQAVTGFALGKMEQEQIAVPTLLGIDGTVWLSGLATVGAMNTSGRTSRYLASMARAGLTVSTYKAGKTFDFE